MEEAYPNQRKVEAYLKAKANLLKLTTEEITHVLNDCLMAPFFDEKSDYLQMLVDDKVDEVRKLIAHRTKEGEKLKNMMLS